MSHHYYEIVRHDQDQLHRFTTSRPLTGWFMGMRRRLTRWFWLLQLSLRQAGFEPLQLSRFQDWRCQPIPVVASTRYPATKRLRARSHFVRI